MAAHTPSITDEQAALIRASRVFFVASPDPALAPGLHGIGPVNVSPKGGVPVMEFVRHRTAGDRGRRYKGQVREVAAWHAAPRRRSKATSRNCRRSAAP